MTEAGYPRDLHGYIRYDVMSQERVWVPTRSQIAQHWHASLAHLAVNALGVG